MSKISREEKRPRTAASPGALVSDTRVDAAHPVEVSSENLAVSPPPQEFRSILSQGISPEELEEQLYRQATQLAEYLRTRQSDLDHRETQLQVQIAQLESDARTARLWLSEREAELLQRQESLARSERQLEHRLQRVAGAEAAHHSRREEKFYNERRAFQQECEEKLQRLHQQEADLQLRAHALQEEKQQLAAQTAVMPTLWEEREAEFQSRLGTLALRQRELETAEQHLVRAQAETFRLRARLAEEQRQFHEEVRSERQQMADAQRKALAEVEKKRQAIQRRNEHLDRYRVALEQLRNELQRMLRETLEIRLATEELWVQLAGAAPPAALTSSLGRVRSQLADQYRLARAELQKQKQELESIREELATQCEHFTAHKKRYEQWAAARQQQIEDQVEQLWARKQNLDDQETRFRQQTAQWEAQRHEYEQTIRSLRLKVAGCEEATARK
jgi:hypothetical protein